MLWDLGYVFLFACECVKEKLATYEFSEELEFGFLHITHFIFKVILVILKIFMYQKQWNSCLGTFILCKYYGFHFTNPKLIGWMLKTDKDCVQN